MLLFDDILKHLNISQKKLNHLYQQSIKYSDINDINLDLPELFFKLNEEFRNYYYYDTNNKNSFIYALLTIFDNNFILNGDKDKYLNDFRKKICYELEEKNYYRIFGYNKKRKYKREKLQKSLLDFGKDVDELVEKYICDYFSINCLIFVINENELNNTFHYLASEVGDSENEYKPLVLLFKKENKYYPILSENNNGILRFTEDKICSYLYEKYMGMNKSISKKYLEQSEILLENPSKKETEDDNESINAEEKNNRTEMNNELNEEKIRNEENSPIRKKRKEPLVLKKKMLLKELQDLAEKHDIEIYKLTNKNKQILKTRKELFEELEEII